MTEPTPVNRTSSGPSGYEEGSSTSTWESSEARAAGSDASEPTPTAAEDLLLGGSVALPEWLVKLSTESWQAELLISGFAIVGSLQLLGVVESLIEWSLFAMRAELLHYVRWAIYYFSLGLIALPAVFIAHFALRTYWVGLVSLSSVFPHGFGKNYGAVPEWVARDIESRSPSLAVQIDRVERSSSIMFAIAALISMVFASIALGLTGTLALAVLLERVSDGVIGFRNVFYVLGGIVLVVYLVSVAMLLLKRFHERTRFRKTYLEINRGFTKVMYTVFAQPASYLSTLLTTNASGRSAVGPAILATLVLIGGVTYFTLTPFAIYLIDAERVVQTALRTDVHYPDRYWDEWPATAGTTLLPSVPSATLSSTTTYLPIYFPLTGDEDYRIDARDPEVERPEGLDDAAWRQSRREDFVRRAGRYLRVRIGERVIAISEVQRMQPPGQRDGLRLTASLPQPLPPGRQVIYLDRRASLEPADTTWEPRAAIPIWVDGASVPASPAAMLTTPTNSPPYSPATGN